MRFANNAFLTSPVDFGTAPGHIRLMLNTDGVKVYRRANKHAWPVWGINANLPPSQRYKLQNLILVGIYFGSHKPDLDAYLGSVFDVVNQSRQEFFVRFVGQADPIPCSIRVLSCPLDMGARVCFCRCCCCRT